MKRIRDIRLFDASNRILAAGIGFGVVFVLFCALSVFAIERKNSLAGHPLYSTYEFNNTDTVVNIGTQPLYMPTGLITETMKRDIIFKKALAEHGVEIRFYPFLKGHDVNAFIRSGDLDAGIGGDMPAISIATKMDIVIASLAQFGFTSIVAGRQMRIDELKGKRIGFAYGSNAHYALLNVLSFAELDESQVDLLSMEVSDMPEALTEGRVDAFAAWEPTPAIAVKQGPGNVIIHRSLSSGYIYFDKSFYDAYPRISGLVLAAEIRALRWMKQGRQNLLRASRWSIDAFNKLSDRKTVLTPEEFADLALKDIAGSHFPPVIAKKEIEEGGRIFREFEFLKKLGFIRASSKWGRVRDSFDREILKRILGQGEAMRLDEFLYDINEGKDG
jgi:NitT/TauT family transport system substrate-binding protein